MTATLALVIPAHNDQAGLGALLAQARALGIFDQIVVVDDASVPALDVAGGVELIQLNANRGPGPARNRGLAAVHTSHALFFDADDSLLPELGALWRDLMGRSYDFCLFRHADSRRSPQGGSGGQMPFDTGLWRLAGMGGQSLAHVSDVAAWELAQTANYPWNKIYRTAFLRAHDIGCAEMRFHEDVALHWRGFAHASSILASDRTCARHEVVAGGARLTNQADPARLQIFEHLADLAPQVAPCLSAGLGLAYLRFAAGLMDWVRGVMGPEYWAAVDMARRRALERLLDAELIARLAEIDPVLSLRLVLQSEERP